MILKNLSVITKKSSLISGKSELKNRFHLLNTFQLFNSLGRINPLVKLKSLISILGLITLISTPVLCAEKALKVTLVVPGGETVESIIAPENNLDSSLPTVPVSISRPKWNNNNQIPQESPPTPAATDALPPVNPYKYLKHLEKPAESKNLTQSTTSLKDILDQEDQVTTLLLDKNSIGTKNYTFSNAGSAKITAFLTTYESASLNAKLNRGGSITEWISWSRSDDLDSSPCQENGSPVSGSMALQGPGDWTAKEVSFTRSMNAGDSISISLSGTFGAAVPFIKLVATEKKGVQ